LIRLASFDPNDHRCRAGSLWPKKTQGTGPQPAYRIQADNLSLLLLPLRWSDRRSRPRRAHPSELMGVLVPLLRDPTRSTKAWITCFES